MLGAASTHCITTDGIFEIEPLVQDDEGTDADQTAPFTTRTFSFVVSRSPELVGAETDAVDFAVTGVDTTTDGASCSSGVDFIAQAGTLHFTAADCGAAECSKTIDVQVCEDVSDEPDEVFEVTLTQNAGSSSAVGSPDVGQGVIINDDAAAPTEFTVNVDFNFSLLSASATSFNVIDIIDCRRVFGITTGDCTGTYPTGSFIELAARCSVFLGWTGDDECNGHSGSIVSIVVDSDMTCTANCL